MGLEAFFTHLARFAIWVFFVGFAFAVVGVLTTIRWCTEFYQTRIKPHVPSNKPS